MKQCTKCLEIKPFDAFYFQRVNSKDGYQSHCKKCDNARKSAWKHANPEKTKKHAQVADSNKYKNNKLSITVRNKLWKKNNPAKVLAIHAKRRAALLQRTPKWVNDFDFWVIEQAYELSVLRTKMFGFAWHVDHIIPLQGKNVSGLHVPSNLRVIPSSENLVKSNRYLT